MTRPGASGYVVPVGRVLVGTVLAAFVSLAATAGAQASAIVTRNATDVVLKVDRKNRAVVYFTANGRRSRVAVWGAVNGKHPSAYPAPQVRFRLDYSGGSKRLGFPLWKRIRNACRPYDGPPLPLFVTGCKTPDGSYWALQSWQRLLPGLGEAPRRWDQRAWELHISHWSGPVAELDLYADWVYPPRVEEIFGRLTYRRVGVHGFTWTPVTEIPTEGYGRNVYIDTYNSRYGQGWRRENGILTWGPGGHFCYWFVPRPSFFDSRPRPAGDGTRYRVTAQGPGVTPIVRRYVAGLPEFDASNPAHVALERRMNALRRQLAAPHLTRCEAD